MTPTALVAGEIYTDLILSGFDVWPQPGQEAFAREFRRELGGGAAITACGLATLGTGTGVFGVVGADHHEWIAARFRQSGVDISDLQIHPHEPTAFTVAVTAPEDRAFFTYLGANRGFPGALQQAAQTGRLSRARHVHLAFAPPWDTAADLFHAIRANGCTISLDSGWHEAWLADPRALAILHDIDLFFPNESEAARITGESDPQRILHRFHEAGIARVALKLGSQGAALLSQGEFFHAGPHPATTLDTTGAGDCFDAGFLHAWLVGETPQTCLRTANICGALSTEAYGGIAAFPSPERLRQEWKRSQCEK